MNIYKELNKIIEYIENHLEEKIETKTISKMIGMSEYTFQRIFAVISNISFSEYIRNRRLSNAGQDLFLDKAKIIDVAVKYKYNNPTAFSRAFEKFHGIKPKEAKESPEKLKLFTKLHFNEEYEINKNIEYKIVEKEEMHLYGNYILTDSQNIKQAAPKFLKENTIKYGEPPSIAIAEYQDEDRMYVKAYWVLYEKKIGNMQEKRIPKSKWIQLRINSQETKDIQETIDTFYKEFFPNCKYRFRDLPEIELYHDGVTEFLIPIE